MGQKAKFGGMDLNISVKSQENWTQPDALWSALSIDKLIQAKGKQPVILSLIGGGGKTSYIRRLAWEGREKGFKVLVMTTTHMASPKQFAVLERDLEMTDKMLEKESIAVAGRPAKDGKIAFWDEDFYKKALELADVVLIEADGSKRLPVKVPGPNEPVIPEDSDAIICIYGLGAVGKQADACCFRLNQAEGLLNLKEEEKNGNWIMTEEKMACLMEKGYLKRFKKEFPGRFVIGALNQADTKEAEETGRNILKRTGQEQGILTGKLYEEPSFDLF